MLTVKMGEAMEGKEEEGESEREGERYSTLLREERSDTSARMYLAKCEGASACRGLLKDSLEVSRGCDYLLHHFARRLPWPGMAPFFYCYSGALPCQVPLS